MPREHKDFGGDQASSSAECSFSAPRNNSCPARFGLEAVSEPDKNPDSSVSITASISFARQCLEKLAWTSEYFSLLADSDANAIPSNTLAELDEDQLRRLVFQRWLTGNSDVNPARHDRLDDVDPIANPRHAVAVNLNVARR